MTDARPRGAVSLDELRKHRSQLLTIGQRHGVRDIRLFGSVARGQSTPASDLDLLVEVQPGHGLLSLSAFAGDVEDLLHVATQVATVNGLRPRIRERILAAAVEL